jgi:capsule polysaccharide export protein KpsE/RkpR
MDDSQSARAGSELRTQTNDVASASAEEVGEGLSLRIARFLRLCWVRRRMVFGILATGILISILYAFHLPVMYTSTTTLMPPDSASSNSNLMSLLSSAYPAASVGSAALGIKSPGALFVGILGSRTVQESVVTRFDLVHHYKKHLIEDACKRLTADTVIRENIKSGIITIDVKADNAVLASNIAQGYVAELDRVVNNNSTSAARRERIFLEERLKEIKKDLDDSAEALSRFSTKSRTIDMPSQARAMVDSGLKLQDELATARSDLAGLRQAYSEDNVRVRTASARVEELQKQMDKITGLSQKSGSSAYTSESDYPSLGALPALGLTYADLNRKVLVEEALWGALTKQYEAAKVQEAKEIPTVRVLDVANVPQRKSSPARSEIVILGAMLSLFVVCISVLAMSAWEEMDAQDERKQLVAAIVNATLNSLRWFWRLPGMSWIHARLHGPEKHR